MISLADRRHADRIARPLARFDLLLAAAVGFTWGPLIFHFGRHVADPSRPLLVALAVALTFALGFIGVRAPAGWFRLRPWERAGAGRVYERYFGIRAFKGWMSHGDRMNRWLRRRIPEYRVVRPTRDAAKAFAEQTVRLERAHLAWGLAALALIAYAVVTGAHGFAALLALANTVTNVWPIMLQRYNRVRVERVMPSPAE